MTARAQEFLNNLIEEFAATGQSPSADLASIAVEEAADEGMNEDELVKAADGDLNAYLAAKLSALRADEEKDTEDPAAEPEMEPTSTALSGLRGVLSST